jgi:hypothetical protein
LSSEDFAACDRRGSEKVPSRCEVGGETRFVCIRFGKDPSLASTNISPLTHSRPSSSLFFLSSLNHQEVRPSFPFCSLVHSSTAH